MVKQKLESASWRRKSKLGGFATLAIFEFLFSIFGLAPAEAGAQQPQSSDAPLFSANAKYVQGVGPGYWPTPGSGLTLNLAAGTAFCGPSPALVTYPGGTLAMAANQTNYVYLDPWAGCAPTSNTTGFVVGHIPLAKVVTSGSALTSITDARGWFQPAPCTIGGGGSVDCRPGIYEGYAWMFVTGVGAAKPILGLYNDTTGWVYGDIEAETETNGVVLYGSGNVTIRAEGSVDMKPGATGSLLTPRLDNIRFASKFPGADWAAKINAADIDIGGGVPGVIYVSSSLAGTATTTLTPSANKRIVFLGGTFSSSAVPNVQIDLSGVSIEGSGFGLDATCTTFNNTGTGNAFIVGNGTNGVRGVSLEGFRITGNPNALSGVKLNANLGSIILRKLHIGSPGTYGVDASAGNHFLIELNQVRVESAKDIAFQFSGVSPSGPILFHQTYANGTTGATSIGYELANGQHTLVGTAADGNTRGYHVGGLVRMYGTASEANTSYGIQIVGGGNISLHDHFSAGDNTPIEISAAGAHVQIFNPRTISTGASNSIVVTSAANGDNAVYGLAGLDKPISVASGGVLQQISKSGNLFVGDLKGSKIFTPVNAVTFSTTPTFDAALANTQKITLTGNVSSSTLSNAGAGQWLQFVICQDGSGSRTFTWPSNMKGGMTIGSTASKCSAQTFIFDGTNAYALSSGATNM